MGIPDHLTCFLRNLYADQEAAVRIGHGTTDWFQIRKGVCQGYILSLCLFNLYAEYIMRCRLTTYEMDEAQAGITIAKRIISNHRCVASKVVLVAKTPPANAGDAGSIPGSGRSHGERNGNPIQYSCLEIPWTEEPGGL